MSNPLTVTTEVIDERVRQDRRWGEQNHPDGSHSIYRNHANIARTAADEAAEKGTLAWRHILIEEVYEAIAEEDPARLRAELIQIAAVAVAWVEAIDRRLTE